MQKNLLRPSRFYALSEGDDLVMTRNMQMAYTYFEKIMGKPLQFIRPVPVSGWQVVEILWPLNDLFRPLLTRIRTIKYDERYELEADKAIELFVQNPQPQTWVTCVGSTCVGSGLVSCQHVWGQVLFLAF